MYIDRDGESIREPAIDSVQNKRGGQLQADRLKTLAVEQDRDWACKALPRDPPPPQW